MVQAQPEDLNEYNRLRREADALQFACSQEDALTDFKIGAAQSGLIAANATYAFIGQFSLHANAIESLLAEATEHIRMAGVHQTIAAVHYVAGNQHRADAQELVDLVIQFGFDHFPEEVMTKINFAIGRYKQGIDRHNLAQDRADSALESIGQAMFLMMGTGPF